MASGTLPENPENCSFLFPVENTLKSCFVCQNTADFHLAQSPLKALKPGLFLPLSLSHTGPERLSEREYEGHFFRGGLKMGFLPG
jgi:hypothetical protein